MEILPSASPVTQRRGKKKAARGQLTSDCLVVGKVSKVK